MDEAITLDELATIISGLYGFVDKEGAVVRPPGQIGIFFALGAIQHAVEKLALEQNPDFDVELWRKETGFQAIKDGMRFRVKDQ